MMVGWKVKCIGGVWWWLIREKEIGENEIVFHRLIYSAVETVVTTPRENKIRINELFVLMEYGNSCGCLWRIFLVFLVGKEIFLFFALIYESVHLDVHVYRFEYAWIIVDEQDGKKSFSCRNSWGLYFFFENSTF